MLVGEPLSRHDMADLACRIEIEKLAMPIGKQDQYAAAFGGLNFFEFRPEGVRVERLDLPGDSLHELERRLMLFFTGRWHDSGQILEEQKRASERDNGNVVEALHEIRELALTLRGDLTRGDIGSVGDLLHKSWLAKRQLAHGITDPWIDGWYAAARGAGARGGKLAGAGGGGFLLLYCEPEHQERVTEALQAAGLARMDFRFESGGAMVLMNNLVRTPASATVYA